jgi:hypothetical protein
MITVDWFSMSRRRREALSGLCVVLLFALPLLPEILGARRLVFRDAQGTHWPWRRVAVEMLSTGEVPFVNATASGGQPMLANPNAVLLYPTFLLERVLPPASAFNLHYLLHVLWAFFGARALAHRLDLSDSAAFLSGVAFAFSGMMLSYGGAFMNSCAAAAWLPWCAAAALDLARAAEPRRRWRAAAALGLALGVQLLAGEPALSLLTLLLSSLLAGSAALTAPRGQRARQLLLTGCGFAAAGLLAVALAAPLLLPLRQVLPLTFRGQHLYSEEAFGAVPLRPARLFEWLFPRLRGDPGVAGVETRWPHEAGAGLSVYIWCVTFGVVPLLAFLSAAVRRGFWTRRTAGWTAGAVAALLLSFGFQLPFYRLLFGISTLRRLRYPIKFYLLTSLCVALLAGLAAQSLGGRRPGRREGILLGVALGLFAIAWALAGPSGPIARWAAEVTGPDSVPFAEAFRGILRGDALVGMLSVLAVGLVLSWRPGTGVAGYPLGLLALLSALVWGLPLFVSAPTEELARAPVLASRLRGPGRLYTPHSPKLQLRSLEPDYPRKLPRLGTAAKVLIEHLTPSTGAPFGVHYLFETDPDGSYGYYNLVAEEAAAASTPAERDRLLRLFGVRWVLAPEGEAYPLFHPSTGLSIGSERLVLFETPDPLPELRWASRAHRRKSLSGTLELVRSEAFLPATDIALPGRDDADPSGPGSSGDVHEAVVRADSARARVEADGPGYLIFSRTFFPAWKARVDGVSSPVLVANGRDLAVAVPAGSHGVEIAYDRRPFRLGVAVQVLALLGALLVTVSARPGPPVPGAPAGVRRYPAGSH